MGDREAYPLKSEPYHALLEVLDSDTTLSNMPEGVRVAIYAMAVCGVRVGEACAMRPGWLTSSERGLAIRVPSEVEGVNRYSPKTGSGARTVPVPSTVKNHATGEKVDVRAEEIIRAYFVGNQEIGCTGVTVGNWLKRAAREAGVGDYRKIVERTVFNKRVDVPDVFNHDLRATWCAQCLRGDINRYKVRDFGGWATTDMVDHYASWVGDPNGEAMDAF